MYRFITPLDGSHLAESALALSARLAARFQSTLHLVHVIGSLTPDEPWPTGSTAGAECYLNEIVARYSGLVSIQIHVLHGSPVEELLSFFQCADDAIVVMSRLGRSGLRRSPFGGVTDRLVHNTMVPILLVDESHQDGSGEMNEILVPLDGSDLASSALPLAVKLAGDTGRLCLVRIVQPPDERARAAMLPPSSFRDPELPHDVAAVAIDEARGFLLRTATRLRQRGTNVSWEVRFGEPSNEILRASESAGAELIVMATHGWGSTRRWAFGSVTDTVIQHGSTPILVVPPVRP